MVLCLRPTRRANPPTRAPWLTGIGNTGKLIRAADRGMRNAMNGTEPARALGGATTLLMALTTLLPAQQFETPVLLTSGGAPIDVDIGHSAPFVADWDGDGKKDLLVGQYGQGRLRVYRNIGTHPSPVFDGFEWFRAGGDIARIWTN